LKIFGLNIRREILERPFLLFSPFLVFSVALVMIFYSPSLIGDEDKYLNYAKNIIHGYYSPPAPNIYLAVGPGYPLVIVPFVALKVPLIYVSFLNAIFYYLSIILVYKTLRYVVTPKLTLIVSLFWAFYYNSYENLQFVSSELISTFLVSALIYFLVKSNTPAKNYKNKYIYIAGFVFGYLAMTKVIFGYVLLFMLAGNGIIWLFYRNSVNYRKGLMVLIVAFITTIPFLTYTYILSGKVFYWGSDGGNNIYWMSTPFEKEYGSWFEAPKQEKDLMVKMGSYYQFRREEHYKMTIDGENIPGADEYIWYNHHRNFAEINKFTGVEQDSKFKQIAFNNIKAHPLKFIENCFCNFGRILFNFPYTYKQQTPRTLLRIPLNGIIFTLLIFTLIPTIINWKKIIFPIRFSIFIFFLYIGGSIFGSAEIRMFTVTVPLLLIWISFVLQKTLKIRLRFEGNK